MDIEQLLKDLGEAREHVCNEKAENILETVINELEIYQNIHRGKKTYTAQDIEKMLTIPCCHTTGMHDPLHYSEGKYICESQIAKAFENLCRTLLINPKVRHSDNCGWCRDYPDKMKGDGKEFWDKPNRCVKCGNPPYVHEYDSNKCDGFEPTSFKALLEHLGGD